MGYSLYVGGISYSTTEEGLRDHFASAGSVLSAKIIMDQETGRSRGFGFVDMASEQDAQKALMELDEQDLDGRQLKIRSARPRA